MVIDAIIITKIDRSKMGRTAKRPKKHDKGYSYHDDVEDAGDSVEEDL